MNYQNTYNALVEKAKARGLDKSQHEGYFEIHHIIPRCLGGSDEKDNLVMFTGREHFISHMLLWKAYPEEVSLMRAAMLMSSFWRDSFGGVGVRTSSRLYEVLREEYAVAVSQQVSGENNPFFGKKHTEDSIQKMKDWWASNPDHNQRMVGYKHTEEALAKMSAFQSNRPPMSDETKKKISDVHLGKPKKPEAIEKTRQFNIGKKKSPEARQKMSDSRKGLPWTEAQRIGITAALKYGEDHHAYGIPKSDETKEKISITLKAKNQRPWENPTCQNFTDQSKWALADYYYSIWCHFDKPGLKKLKKIYDYINNDDISISLLATMRIDFSEGWIPAEDEEWLEFSKEY